MWKSTFCLQGNNTRKRRYKTCILWNQMGHQDMTTVRNGATIILIVEVFMSQIIHVALWMEMMSMVVTFFYKKTGIISKNIYAKNLKLVLPYSKNVQFNINKLEFYVLLIQGISDIRWEHDKYHVSVHCDKRFEKKTCWLLHSYINWCQL